MAAGIVPPLSAAVVPPAVATTVPPHVLLVFGGDAIVIPAGSESVSDVAVAAPLFVLIKETVSVDFCPAETEMGLKPLLMPTSARTAVDASAAETKTRSEPVRRRKFERIANNSHRKNDH